MPLLEAAVHRPSGHRAAAGGGSCPRGALRSIREAQSVLNCQAHRHLLV